MQNRLSFSRILLVTGVLILGTGMLVAFAPVQRTKEPVKIGLNVGLGNLVPSIKLKSVDGKVLDLTDRNAKATVIALTSTTCPLCKKYGPTLARLEKEFAPLGVRTIYLAPEPDANTKDLSAMATRLGLRAPIVKEQAAQFAATLGAKTTTQVFVVDANRTLIYSGAVDNQYTLGATKDAPTENYLREAVQSALRNERPARDSTEAPGCTLPDTEPIRTPVSVTYHNQVERIMQRKCMTCHYDGGVGPFQLATFQQVKDRAPMIKTVIERGIMPPWFAEREKESPTHWKNDKSLSPEEKETVLAWVKNGAPQGDPKDAPAKLTTPTLWQKGKPDALFQIPTAVKVKADGYMDYHNVTIETNFKEDKWIQATEILPTARQVVHHVLVFVIPPGSSRDEALGGLNGFAAAYVPGNSIQVYPEGLAKLVPAGSKLRFQIHYTPNGEAVEDQTRLAFYFSKKKPDHEVRSTGIFNLMFRIPPGANNHKVEASINVPADANLLAFLPHMHVRGKACQYELTDPKGEKSMLINIPRYDFNWQLGYDYQEPKPVEKGSKITFRAWFDNSKDNPANPDPTKTVQWGEQTFEEMHLGYVEYYFPSFPAGQPTPDRDDPRIKQLKRSIGDQIKAFFNRLDKNHDGKLTPDELKDKRMFKAGDINGDGVITLDEAKKALGDG